VGGKSFASFPERERVLKSRGALLELGDNTDELVTGGLK